MKKRIQIALTALALVGAAVAQEAKVYGEGQAWVKETTGSLPAQRNLKPITTLGSVHIQGGTATNISYTVKKGVYSASKEEAQRVFDLIRVTARTQGDTGTLYGQGPRNCGRGRSYSADFDIRTPRALDLVNAHTGGGSLTVNSINGQVDADTGGGNVSLDNIGGAIDASSGGGSVDVGTAGSEVKLETGGGKIRQLFPKRGADCPNWGGSLPGGLAQPNHYPNTEGGVHVGS